MAPFKSGKGRNLGKLLKSYRTQNIGNTFPVTEPFSATGGDHVLTPGNGYKYHTFTQPGTFVTEGGPYSVEFILVAGGGGGGGCNNSAAGGGGGGGMVISSGFDCGYGTHPVTVGTGGAGQVSHDGALGTGGDSKLFYSGSGAFTATAKGGGGGDGPQGGSGGPGGSGGGNGGAAIQGDQNPGITHITNYGNPAPGEGGGGAGASGTPTSYGGDGQPAPGFEYPVVLPSGLATPLEPYSPTNNHYAGGGGGYPSGANGNSLGGGGQGQPTDAGNGYPGIDLLGGGGGNAWSPQTRTGGDGGDGIVILRYQV